MDVCNLINFDNEETFNELLETKESNESKKEDFTEEDENKKSSIMFFIIICIFILFGFYLFFIWNVASHVTIKRIPTSKNIVSI